MLAFLFAILWILQIFAFQYVVTVCVFWCLWRMVGVNAAKVGTVLASLLLSPLFIAASLIGHLPKLIDDIALHYGIELNMTPFIALLGLVYLVLPFLFYYMEDEVSSSGVEVELGTVNISYKVDTESLQSYYLTKRSLRNNVGGITLLMALVVQAFATYFIYVAWS